MTNGQHTGTRDEHFNLVSVLYHTLEEADTIQKYIDDARKAGDDELASFFEDVQSEDRQRSERAKHLLSARIPQTVS